MIRKGALLIVAILVMSSLITATDDDRSSLHPISLESVSNFSLRFEPNRGQTDETIQYLASTQGFMLFLKPDEAVFSLTASSSTGTSNQDTERKTLRTSFSMRIVDACTKARAVAAEKLPGVSHYFRGKDPSCWTTSVPGYNRITFQDVYPGIDLLYRGCEQRVAYDFILAPGADPSRIRLAFDGVEALKIDEKGDLCITVGHQELIHKAPVVYQKTQEGKEMVTGRFALCGDFEVRFILGTYDAERPLIIDPTVEFSTWLGGTLRDCATAVGVDQSGNVYIAGFTDSPDFPGAGVSYGDTDAFVAKLDPTGTQLLYATYLGGSLGDSAVDIAVDSVTGDAYITGSTESTDFPVYPVPGAFQTAYGGDIRDGIMSKLDSDGLMAYSTYIGGMYRDLFKAIALGPTGQVYMTGWANADFPTTPGAYQELPTSGSDAFLLVLNPAGQGALDLVYSTYIGGASSEMGLEIAVDFMGHAYMVGQSTTNSQFPPYFPTTPNAYRPTQAVPGNSGGNSAFLAKMAPSGNGSADLLYSTFFFFNPGLQMALAVAVDDYGRAYVTGCCHDQLPSTSGAFDDTYNGGKFFKLQDAFLMVLNTEVDGAAGLEYATYIGGYDGELPWDIVVRGASLELPGTAFIIGELRYEEKHSKDKVKTPFPVTPDAFKDIGDIGDVDAFLVVLSPLGNEEADLLFSTLIGGNGNDDAHGVVLNAAGDVYLAGGTYSDTFSFEPPFDTGFGSGVDRNAYVMKILFAPQIPEAPSDLTATAVSSIQINLAWVDNSQGEQGFRIERSEEGGPWVEIDSTAPDVTVYPDTGLDPDTTYAYRVLAFNGAGESDYSNEASGTTFPTGGGTFHALGETSVAGTVSGTYVDTHSADDVYESITEKESGGKPSKRYSYLEHKWVFNITGGSTVTFHVQAYQDASIDGDNFVFAWSSDDSSYTEMVTVNKTADDDIYQSFSLPGSLSGTVYIRVKDTDRNQGNRSKDTLYVDHMFIEVE